MPTNIIQYKNVLYCVMLHLISAGIFQNITQLIFFLKKIKNRFSRNRYFTYDFKI